MSVLLIVQLVLVGLRAGEEFVVRRGVQPALNRLPDDAHVRTRIALAKSLKVVVPILMVPAVLASVATGSWSRSARLGCRSAIGLVTEP